MLAAGRADLITVRIMGWADGSPALDYTVNNSVGYPMLTGTGPEPVNHVLPAWDLLSGAYAAFALLAAIQRRTATGAGGEVRVPLSDVAIGTVANLGGVAEVLYSGADRPRLGNAVYGLFGRDFVTADGQRTMIVVVTPRQWANLVAALGLGEAIAAVEAARGVSFAKDDGLRFTHRDALYPLFERGHCWPQPCRSRRRVRRGRHRPFALSHDARRGAGSGAGRGQPDLWTGRQPQRFRLSRRGCLCDLAAGRAPAAAPRAAQWRA